MISGSSACDAGGQRPAARPLCSADSVQVSLLGRPAHGANSLSLLLPPISLPPSCAAESVFRRTSHCFEDGYVMLYSPVAFSAQWIPSSLFDPKVYSVICLKGNVVYFLIL